MKGQKSILTLYFFSSSKYGDLSVSGRGCVMRIVFIEGVTVGLTGATFFFEDEATTLALAGLVTFVGTTAKVFFSVFIIVFFTVECVDVFFALVLVAVLAILLNLFSTSDNKNKKLNPF